MSGLEFGLEFGLEPAGARGAAGVGRVDDDGCAVHVRGVGGVELLVRGRVKRVSGEGEGEGVVELRTRGRLRPRRAAA